MWIDKDKPLGHDLPDDFWKFLIRKFPDVGEEEEQIQEQV